jgi:hypothetical protein
VVLIGLLLVIVAVVLLIWRPWSGSGSAPAASTPTPTETPLPTIYPSTAAVGTPAPEATATAAGPAACTPATVNLTAVTDATGYAADAIPQLSLTMTNTGSADCVINAGTSQQVFTITSGSDTIWKSTDCQTESSDLEILLTAGQTVNGSAIPWDRTRSSPDTCAGGREAVVAGGAAYNLSVSVGTISSTSATQFLLN